MNNTEHTDNEQRIIDAIVEDLRELAQRIRLTPDTAKDNREYGRTFGRYIEAKWALGMVLLIAEGMPNLAGNRTHAFEWANAYVDSYAPQAQIFKNGLRVG